MEKTKWPTFKECTGIELVAHDGEDDTRETIDVVPTMKRITINGKTYHRVDQSRAYRKDGRPLAVFLWDGWADAMMAKKAKEKG